MIPLKVGTGMIPTSTTVEMGMIRSMIMIDTVVITAFTMQEVIFSSLQETSSLVILLSEVQAIT